MPEIHNVCFKLLVSFKSGLKSTCIPHTKLNLALAELLRDQGFLTSVMIGSEKGPHVPCHRTKEQVWMDLRYTMSGLPALQEIRCISKPSRRLFADPDELATVASGRCCKRLLHIGRLKTPLIPGELIAVRTPIGVIDLFSAVKNNVGGEILCSVK